jgi:hypothetical protein
MDQNIAKVRLELSRRADGSEGGPSLNKEEIKGHVTEVIGEYNRIIGAKNSKAELDKVNDPYLLTLDTVLCEMSTGKPYSLSADCKEIDEANNEIQTQLADLIHKAHHEEHEPVETPVAILGEGIYSHVSLHSPPGSALEGQNELSTGNGLVENHVASAEDLFES